MMRPRRPLFALTGGSVSSEELQTAESELTSLGRALAEDGRAAEELPDTRDSIHAGWAELVERIRSQETVTLYLTKH